MDEETLKYIVTKLKQKKKKKRRKLKDKKKVKKDKEEVKEDSPQLQQDDLRRVLLKGKEAAKNEQSQTIAIKDLSKRDIGNRDWLIFMSIYIDNLNYF